MTQTITPDAAPAAPVRRRRVRGDGVDLAVYEQGDTSRPTVLLMHGYPDTHAVWDEVAARLADRYHVVRYDVRGSGASSRPFGRKRYTFDYLMSDMRAVLDATAPERKVHLVGHDWGSIQSWEAACTMPERFASFTSISGPCLDHVAHWTRRTVARPTPANLKRAAGQGVRSWYIYFFQTPVLPELMWLAGLSRPFSRALELGEGVAPRDGHPARTMARDGASGVGLYRANMVQRLRRPRDRRTDVPTQVIVPTKDLFVSPHLVGGLSERVPNLSLRPIAAGHWVPRSHPDVIARWITEHITGVQGGPLTAAESRALSRARVRRDRRAFDGSLVVVTGAAAADDLDEVAVDHRLEDGAEDREEGIGDGVELEHDGAVAGVQLVQHVERGDGEDVAGAQDQRHAVGPPRRPLAEPCIAVQPLLGDARLRPDLGVESVEQEPVEGAVGQHPDGEPTTGRLTDVVAREDRGAVGQALQCLLQRLGVADQGVGAADPFLAHERRRRIELLDPRSDANPLRRVRVGGLHHLEQHVAALGKG